MKLLHSSLNFNKTVHLRKASEAIKRKGRVCVPLPMGETQQLPYSGKTFICRLNSKWIHLHLPSQPAPGAGWMTHNATQMSLPSRVHQLKLINIPPHAEDASPAQRAAGRAMAEHDDSSSGRGSRSPGQQVYLAGSREGHSEALASQAHILCRQSWVVYKSRAEGIWLQREVSALHSGLKAPERGFHTGRLGATPYRKQNNTHTQNKTKKPPSPLALNAHPDAVAEAQFCTQTKTPDEKPKDLRGWGPASLSCSQV